MSNTTGLTSAQIEDAKRISSISPEALARALETVESLKPSIRFDSLLNTLSDIVSRDEAKSIFRWAYFLRLGKWQHDDSRSTEEIARLFSKRFIENDISINIDNFVAVGRIAKSSVFYALMNAQRLAYNAEHIFVSGEIVVDTRPVFDEERENALGDIAMPFLKITYTEDSSNKIVSLLMDSGDIDRLTTELDRARRKLQILKEKASEEDFFIVGDNVVSNV